MRICKKFPNSGNLTPGATGEPRGARSITKTSCRNIARLDHVDRRTTPALETQRVPCRAFFGCKSQPGAASLRPPIIVVRLKPTRVRRDLQGRSLRFAARPFKLRRTLGDGHDFRFDRCFDYYCCRRDLLLGHRKIRPRFSAGKSSQAAGGADLSGSHPATGSPDGRNWRAVAAARSAENHNSHPRCQAYYSSWCHFILHLELFLMMRAEIRSNDRVIFSGTLYCH
jgi:hypothetical protein